MTKYNDRFKDALWYNTRPDVSIGGAGGIGSNALYCLTKSIPGSYFVMDMDIVEDYNVGSQFFNKNQVGMKKVAAIAQTVSVNTDDFEVMIHPFAEFVDANSDILPFAISAFDNMTARKNFYEAWLKNPDRKILIDGRLRATYYQIYTVLPGREKDYEATLFSDDEVDDGLCTFKQTAYFGMMIGARITNILVNYLTNIAVGEEINVVPFMIEESGDLLYFNVKP